MVFSVFWSSVISLAISSPAMSRDVPRCSRKVQVLVQRCSTTSQLASGPRPAMLHDVPGSSRSTSRDVPRCSKRPQVRVPRCPTMFQSALGSRCPRSTVQVPSPARWSLESVLHEVPSPRYYRKITDTRPMTHHKIPPSTANWFTFNKILPRARRLFKLLAMG